VILYDDHDDRHHVLLFYGHRQHLYVLRHRFFYLRLRLFLAYLII
jgi:hypothetical protein